MSRCHTRGSIVGARKRPYFFTFSFIFARFGRFGGFVSVVSLVSLVSVVSFRPFRFVVSVLVHANSEACLDLSDIKTLICNIYLRLIAVCP